MLEMQNTSDKPVRVLHVLTAMKRAGAETMVMNLYRTVDRQRIQFDFAVSTNEKCDYDDEIIALGGRIYRYPRYKGINHFAYKKWWNQFFDSHSEYRIVHGHIGSTASIYLKIAKKHGMYAIAHSHSTGGKANLHDALYKAFSYPTRFVADYFLGCSTEALISRYGKRIANRQDIHHILNNGIDVEKYAYDELLQKEIRKELGLKDNAFVVGTVGRFTEAKNIFFIVDIIREMMNCDPDFHFLWAGTGELKKQLEEYMKRNEVEKCVTMLGVRDDIPRVLQALNVFILPSKFEGLPVIGVEVQAAGVPLICSDHVSKELKMSDCVTFLPIDSTEKWVSAILKERQFRRVNDAPSGVVRAGYDIHKTASWLMEFYESRY